MKIKNIGTVVTGKTPQTSHSEYYNGEYMFVTPNELHGGFTVSSTERTITESGIKSIGGNYIDGISVMVGCIGWDMGNVAMSFRKCATNQQINSITKIKEFVNPYWLYYWLSTKKEYLFSIASVTRTPILSKGVFEEIDVPVIERKDQDRIVSVLLPLDKKIENNKVLITDYENIVKAIYEYWFVQFDFPNSEGKPYKSSSGRMVWNNEVKKEIPEGWMIQPIGKIITEREKSTVQVGEASNHNGDIPFFTSGSEIIMYDKAITSGRNCYLNTGGKADVKYYIGEAAYSTDTWCITAGDYSTYLFEYLSSIKKYLDISFFAGSGLKHLQKDALKKHKVVVPPQREIYLFNTIVEKLYQNSSNLKVENQFLINIRNFLLPMLMNGQVKVQ